MPPVATEAPVAEVQTVTPAAPVSLSLPQAQTALPVTIQGCPQVPRLQILRSYTQSLSPTRCWEEILSYLICCDMLIFHYAQLGAVSGKFGHSDDWHDGPDGLPRPALAHPPQRSGPNRWSRWCGSSHLANNQFSFSSRLCSHECSWKPPETALRRPAR